MLRFYLYVEHSRSAVKRFKYILCYGSTWKAKEKGMDAILFKYILCYGSTYLFSNTASATSLFKYILCYGSTQDRN